LGAALSSHGLIRVYLRTCLRSSSCGAGWVHDTAAKRRILSNLQMSTDTSDLTPLLTTENTEQRAHLPCSVAPSPLAIGCITLGDALQSRVEQQSELIMMLKTHNDNMATEMRELERSRGVARESAVSADNDRAELVSAHPIPCVRFNALISLCLPELWSVCHLKPRVVDSRLPRCAPPPPHHGACRQGGWQSLTIVSSSWLPITKRR
jgi:hypothetical protein